MRVAALRLANVRAYGEAEVIPGERVTVLQGPNASGKSTLLEAAGLFATLSSPRTSRLSELVSFGRVEGAARLEWPGGPGLEIRVRAGRTTLRSAGSAVQAKDFLGRFRAVLFTPEDLDLVRGEPELRRRALDELLVQIRPAYRSVKQEFERALRQRNAALRAQRSADASLYDQALALSGAQVVRARREMIARLGPEASAMYGEVAGDHGGEMSLGYKQTSGLGEVTDEDLEQALLRRYDEDLSLELQRGTTRAGPHRDDLQIDVRGAAARSFASRGEQRSAALAFRLAQLRLASAAPGASGGAVLLLDDVLSELDGDRRDRVFEVVGDAQVIVTTTDLDMIPARAKVDSVWQVRRGTVSRR